jgi:hypothetical protein
VRQNASPQVKASGYDIENEKLVVHTMSNWTPEEALGRHADDTITSGSTELAMSSSSRAKLTV